MSVSLYTEGLWYTYVQFVQIEFLSEEDKINLPGSD